MSIVYNKYIDLPKDIGIIFEEPSFTQQQFAEEADINAITERYRSTGYLSDPLNPGTNIPSFGNFSSEHSFLDAQLIISRSYEMFDSLPSSLRERFSNDPSRLLAFVDDESNFDEAVKLGLLSPLPVEDIPHLDKSIPNDSHVELS